jgi:hypothetical protein
MNIKKWVENHIIGIIEIIVILIVVFCIYIVVKYPVLA